jgi:hypothetical protein
MTQRILHTCFFRIGMTDLRFLSDILVRTRAQTNQMTALAAFVIIGASLIGLQLYWTRNESLGKVRLCYLSSKIM